MAKDENFHGYKWSDGSVRQHPEPRGMSMEHVKAREVLPYKVGPALKPPTPEQYAKAYAEWVKEFSEWRAKYGTR